MTKHKDSKRYVPLWDLCGGGHVRLYILYIRIRKRVRLNYSQCMHA